MGQKLKDTYARAEALGGMAAKVRLAFLTTMTSTQADTEPDSPENLARFGRAIESIEKEFGGRSAIAVSLEVQANRPSESAGEREQRLRQHTRVFVDLMSQRSLFLGDVERTIARVDEAAAQTLECGRVSTWFYDDKRSLIRCADLYEAPMRKHSSGAELAAKDFPGYFRALGHERTIAAHDACTDPRTSEFSEVYLKPLGIQSMLDVPIWANGRMVGVVCHEHTGPKRNWISDEENFAFLMANFVALALENRKALTGK
jgi:GAF domain-containing protein